MDNSTGSRPDRHVSTPASFHRTIAIGSLIAGALVYAVFTRGHDVGYANLVALGIVVVFCLMPGIGSRLFSVVDRLRHLTPRQLHALTAGVFAVATVYLFATAMRQARDMFPSWHDQQMTLIQTQMLARGKLWMHSHPCADFFETFYVFVKPVYAALYFPGAALFFVPAVWLHLPFATIPLLVAGALAALLFRIVSELIDPVAGLAAAALLVSLWIFRLLSLWLMSHLVFTLLALWAVWSWMKWRGHRRTSWALSLGAAMGWMAITRPVDAIAYGLPLGLAILWDLRRQPIIVSIRSLALIVVAATPFLALQLIQDKGITGRWFKTPIQYYDDLEMPGASAFGGEVGKSFKATSTLPQKQRYEEDFILPMRQKYARQSWAQFGRQRIQSLLNFTLPSAPKSPVSRTAALLILLLPAGVYWAFRDPRRLVVVAPAGLFVAGYMFHPEVLDHYCITAAPGVILAILGGGAVLSGAWPVARQYLGSGIALAAVGLAVTSLPEFHLDQFDDDSWAAITFNYDILPTQVRKPALVLYRYWKLKEGDTERNFNDEPVYNVDVPWPDDAPIIRAHDLGHRDFEIIQYYARIQPDRNVYVVDRAQSPNLEARLIGTAGDLARQMKPGDELVSK